MQANNLLLHCTESCKHDNIAAWCFLAVDTAFWLYLWRLLRNNHENCETPSPCQTLSSCLRATRATLWRRLKVSFS